MDLGGYTNAFPPPNMPGPGAMYGGMPGAMPGAMYGGMPGSMSGAMPGAMPGAMYGSMSGAGPGVMPVGIPCAPPGGMPGAMPSWVPCGMPHGGVPGAMPAAACPTPCPQACVAGAMPGAMPAGMQGGVASGLPGSGMQAAGMQAIVAMPSASLPGPMMSTQQPMMSMQMHAFQQQLQQNPMMQQTMAQMCQLPMEQLQHMLQHTQQTFMQMQQSPQMMMMGMMQQQQQQKMMMMQTTGGHVHPAGSSTPAGQQAASRPPEPAPDAMDPEVQELGDYFQIEDRWIKRLNETMQKRQHSKEADLAKLYEVLEHARSPTGLLTVKIGEMECGRFVGKIKPDKDVEAMSRKFKLDEHVKSRLTELVVRRKDTREEDLETFTQHLKYSKRPSAMAMILVGRLLEGELASLPDLSEAETLMNKYRLDEDAKSKLAEIMRSRPNDSDLVLEQIQKQLDGSVNPSSVLCKIAMTLIDGGNLKDPPPKPPSTTSRPTGAGKEDRPDREKERRRDGDRDRDRDRSRDRRKRSRSRSRR